MPRILALSAAAFAAASACSLAAFTAWPAKATQSGVSVEGRANVSLTSFSITPAELHLKAGHPVLLRISNDSGVAHDLTAPEFFAAATVEPSRPAVIDGKVSLASHQQVIVRLVPSAGRYPVKCSHPFHKMFGMSGTIVVDR